MTEQSNMFRNPFSCWNADVYSDEELLEFWENPIECEYIESSIYNDRKSLFFSGPRGSGKTMILRYYSYEVQKAKAKDLMISLKQHFENIKGIGLYIRLDKWAITNMNGKNYPQEEWDKIFNWYKELFLCNALLDVLKDLENEGCISTVETETFIKKFFLGIKFVKQIHNLDDFINIVSDSIEDINEFRTRITTENCLFEFRNEISYKLIFKDLAKLSKEHIPFLNNIKFAILLEQYEDYSKNQQRIINSLMVEDQFSDILLRVSMRTGGLHTRETLNPDKEIIQDQDFVFIYTQCIENFNRQKEFLERIANKRLRKYENFDDNITYSIKQFLGDEQDFVSDFIDIVSDLESKAENQINNMEESREKEVLDSLVKNRKCSCEMVYKHGAYIYAAKNSAKPGRRIERLYYGFDVISRLSDGNVRYFLNVCERIFRIASFECKDEELCLKTISKQLQNKAVYETSLDEIVNHRRIPDVGENIYNMVVNIGNLFEKYQCDIRNPRFGIRTVRFEDLSDIMVDVIKYSLIWGVLLESKNSQRCNDYVLKGSMIPLFGLNAYLNDNIVMKINKDEYDNLKVNLSKNIKTSVISKEDENASVFLRGWNNDTKV